MRLCVCVWIFGSGELRVQICDGNGWWYGVWLIRARSHSHIVHFAKASEVKHLKYFLCAHRTYMPHNNSITPITPGHAICHSIFRIHIVHIHLSQLSFSFPLSVPALSFMFEHALLPSLWNCYFINNAHAAHYTQLNNWTRKWIWEMCRRVAMQRNTNQIFLSTRRQSNSSNEIFKHRKNRNIWPCSIVKQFDVRIRAILTWCTLANKQCVKINLTPLKETHRKMCKCYAAIEIIGKGRRREEGWYELCIATKWHEIHILLHNFCMRMPLYHQRGQMC